MVKRSSTITAIALASASLVACVDSDEPMDDGAGGADGKADGYTINSPEAQATFRLVNTIGLRSVQDIVGDGSTNWWSLSNFFAEARSLGGINTLGLGLQGLTNAGGFTLWLPWVKEVGYLPVSGDASDPFSPASCAGGRLNGSDLVAWIAPGAVEAPFGTYEVFARRRICSATGCGAWEAKTQVANGTARVRLEGTDPRLVLRDSKRCTSDPSRPALQWDNSYRLADGPTGWSNEDVIGLPTYQMSQQDVQGSCGATPLRPGLGLYEGNRQGNVRFLGGVADTCFRFVSRPMRVKRDASTQWEEQYVVLGKHD
jgi:hypothetical protein